MQGSNPAIRQARGKPTILIVDDSPTIRKLVSMTLESRGYTVVVACDGVDGLAKMQEDRPDLILSDITMPRLDGYQFCKVIKSNKETKNIPVIMLSGNDGLFDKVRGRMAGSSNYITKPFEPNNLVKEIEKFVKAFRPVKARSATAATRQPATAQGPPPARKKSGRPQPFPVDPAAAKQLTQKLSGIYIPSAATGSTGSRAESPAPSTPPSGAQGRREAPPKAAPQAQAAKRPTARRNDEPEIKIFYNNDVQAAASSPETVQPPRKPSAPAQSAPAAQRRQAPDRPQAQPAATRPQRPPAPAAKSAAPARPAKPQPAAAAGQLLKATCSGCGTVYGNIKPVHVGKYARCKKCGTRFLITV